MKHFSFVSVFLLIILFSCSDPVPVKENFSGVYRIISIEEEGARVTPPLNQIELTSENYIYRVDKNGDNRFSQEEVVKKDYDFIIDEAGKPYLVVSGNPDRIYLQPDNHYDLLFVRDGERKTILSTRSARISMKSSPKEFYGKYRIIKFRENGKILNIGNSARITVTKNDYVSELDMDGNGSISSNERSSVPYTQVRNDNNITGLKLKNSQSPVWLLKEPTYDLVLLKIDEWGNETVMYLKKNSLSGKFE